ncbi:MAG: tetratricopeptide (TPR) repeat protein [Pseudohongiellaceae bacterium]|jgi:tetratricopeptide (TPR) repeat protein
MAPPSSIVKPLQMRLINIFKLALSAAALSSCAVNLDNTYTDIDTDTDTQANSALQTAVEAPPKKSDEVEYGTFTEQQLYQTIISELGAQRGEVIESGDTYFDLAMETRDLQFIERAVQFASVNGDTNALLQLGLLWAEVDPQNPQPHLMLSFQFLETGNFRQALAQMSRVIEKGGEFDFTALASRTSGLGLSARAALIGNLQQLVKTYPAQLSIRTSLVQLLAQNTQYMEALSELDALVKLEDLTADHILLRAQIQQSMQLPSDALKTLRSGVRRFDDDQDLRLSYARLLIQNQDFEAAQGQFKILMDQRPNDWETLFSIALLDLEMEDYPEAIQQLDRLVAEDQRLDESEYYLGFSYEKLEEFTEAIRHYKNVRIGTTNFLPAQQQATRLAIQLGQLDKAHEWILERSRGNPRLEVILTTIESGALVQNGHIDRAKDLLDSALNKYLNDTDLLFSRVLIYDTLKDRVGSETDLRQIILMKPDDSRALNHLGYMLADQTERYQEALELLERAIDISPDDPAILDSLAWAQYKLGQYEESLSNLRKAFVTFPDHEVASHIGEVLWTMGRRDEARKVWADALVDRPDSELIREAMERLGAT